MQSNNDKEQQENAQRPIRQAVIAETGRQLLDRLNITQIGNGLQEKKKKLGKKRNISERTAQANDPGTTKIPKLKVDPEQARKPGVVPKMWTPEEDELLHKAISKHGERNWRAIAAMVPGRSYIQCLQRWKKALRPGLRKGHWSKEEDASLLKLVEKYKPDFDWGLISKQIPGRNAKQCRERWFLNLDPSINRGPWTPEEDEQLLNFVAQLGGRWALIAKHMEGRTENSVKTRFHSLQRKEARNREWTKEEDEQLIAAVLKFGREFDKIDGMIKGRTKGQIKKRFSVLTQQRPNLIREVYAVEESLRQQKAAQMLNRTNSSENNQYSRHLAGSANFNNPGLQRQNSLSDGNLVPHNSSWMNSVVDNIPSTLRKTNSTRVIEDILKPNRIIEDGAISSKPNTFETGDVSNNLQRWGSSSMNRFLSNGAPSMSLPTFNSSVGVNSSQQKDQNTKATNPNMELFDKLINETKSSTPQPNKQQNPQFPQTYNSNSFLYNPACGLSQDGLIKRNSTYGLDALNNLQYDTNSVLFSQNSLNKAPLQRASSSIGSVGLATYDSSDMKSFLNMI